MSMTASARATTRATVTLGWMTRNKISDVRASGGRLARVPSCWAARTSVDRAEIAVPTQIDQPASSGANKSWARNQAGCQTVVTTAWLAPKRTAVTKTANRAYATPTEGMIAASALPSRNSSRRMGVVSTGSSVP